MKSSHPMTDRRPSLSRRGFLAAGAASIVATAASGALAPAAEPAAEPADGPAVVSPPQGKRILHVLDLIYPTEEDPAGRRRPGWSERRENRARLKARLLRELWNEGGGALEPWQEVQLIIADEVKTLLDTRRILVEDIQQAIYHAEHTEEKLCHDSSGHFLAFFRPRAVTFWVEYSLRDSGFEVHNAYSHRMAVERQV